MPATPAQQFVTMLAALSQATRLRIVAVVAGGGEQGVAAGDIARAVHCPASTLSFHLKELAQAGLLSPTPQGRFIRYSVAPAAFAALAGFIASLPGAPAAAGARAAAPAARTKRKSGARGKEEPSQAATEGQLSIFGD